MPSKTRPGLVPLTLTDWLGAAAVDGPGLDTAAADGLLVSARADSKGMSVVTAMSNGNRVRRVLLIVTSLGDIGRLRWRTGGPAAWPGPAAAPDVKNRKILIN